MTLSIEEYNSYNPLSAYLEGKSGVEKDVILERFANLQETEKLILVGTNTAETIATLISAGTLPQNFGKAVAKIIYLVLNGEVPLTGVDELLERLGLPAVQSQQVSITIDSIVAPIISVRASESASMPELPPMTQKIPPVAPAPDSSKAAGRNIIDLRKQQGGQ